MRALLLESLPYRSAFHVGSHHYADRFVKDGWDAMWVSHPISPLHFLHRIRRDFEIRVEGWRHGPIEQDGLSYYSPMTLLPSTSLPVLRSRFVARNSARATLPNLPGIVRGAGFDRPDLVWLTDPLYAPIAWSFDAGCVAMRVADDTAAFRGSSSAFSEMEAEALRRADLVFAVSDRVYRRLSGERSGVIRLPNGVDVSHFEQPRPEPADIAHLPRPRVLYVGALEYWFDVDLVVQAARRSPEMSFVLIGPVMGADVTALEACANVHLLGARPYADLPGYLQHCDAGIVPFVRDELVDAIHPIKVYEYLAAGLGVAAVSWPELEGMHAPIESADRAGFLDALDRVLVAGAQGRSERVDYARANSWDARYAIVSDAIRGFLEGK